MMDNKFKISIALIIPYVFLCSGLYHIAFWTPFQINILTFLDITDIIKSIILPFLYSSFASIAYLVILYMPSYETFSGINIKDRKQNKSMNIVWSLVRISYSILIMFFLLVDESKWKGLYVPWIITPALYYIVVKVIFNNVVIKQNREKFFVVLILVFLPLFCFHTGTYNARKIFQNKEFDYSDNIVHNKVLKYLSKTTNHYVFVSIDNSEKYFFSLQEVKSLKLKQFKKKAKL